MTILSIFKQKKRKRSRRAYLIEALDKITSVRVRTRDGYECRVCGGQKQTGRVYHHHIFTKIRLSTRWKLENGVTLCIHCHRWAHSAGEEFRAWVISWMGQKEYDALYLKSQMRGGFKEIDLVWLLREMRMK